MPTLIEYRRKANQLMARLEHARQNVAEERRRLELAQAKVENARQAQVIVQIVARAIQEQAHNQIASVVTRCLEAVFQEDAYEFRIIFEKKRGRTEARLAFVRDGEEYDPTDSSGGGAVDVAAFSLRLACLVLHRPKLRLLLVMDEPFKHLSKDYRPAVRDMLLTLATEMKLQILMVTHDPDLACGNVVELD